MTKARLKTIDRILEILGESHTIAVCSHMRPDGDCIGSTLGLALALLEQGKEVICWNQDPVPDKLRFLDPDQLIQAPRPIKRAFDRLAKLGLNFPGRLADGAKRLALGRLVADGGDEYGGGMEVVRDTHLAHADEAKLDRELAPENLVELPFEQFSHAHVAQVGHGRAGGGLQ